MCAGRSRSVDASDQFHQLFQIFARRFLAGNRAEKDGELGDQLLVLEDVIGDAPGIHGGVIEESVGGYWKNSIQWATKNCLVVGSRVGAVPTSGRNAVVICKATRRKMTVQIRIIPPCVPW